MPTIIATTTPEIWEKAKKEGSYTNSTITSSLKEVGFIHCTTPDQVIEMVNRNFTDLSEILLLIIDTDKLVPELRFEAALSGRPGLFPHIYGPLNINAVVRTVLLDKSNGVFSTQESLKNLE